MGIFRRPAIQVFQDIVSMTVSTNAPFMDLCIVGPIYRVHRDVKLGSYIGTGDNTATLPFTGVGTGNVVDLQRVGVECVKTEIAVWPVSASAVTTGEVTIDNSSPVTKLTLSSGTFGPATVGDFIVRDGQPDIFIKSVSEDKKSITLQKNITTGTTLDIYIGRHKYSPVGTFNTSAVYTIEAAGVTNTAAITYIEDGVTYPVCKADIVATYRELRKDLANEFLNVNRRTVATEYIGRTDPMNPMSVAVDVVYSNVNVPFRVLPVESDDLAGYSKATSIMSTNESVYSIAPLTQDIGIIQHLVAHCREMSDIVDGFCKSKWRILWANTQMPVTKVVVDVNSASFINGAAGTVVLTDTDSGQFNSVNSVRVNDYVDVYTGSDVSHPSYSLKVIEVANDQVIILGNTKYVKNSEGYVVSEPVAVASIATASTVNYQITRVLDNNGIAEAMAARAHSFDTKRLRLLVPDECVIRINNASYIMPGYFVAVAYAAMRAGFPPHQGFSTMTVGGIEKVSFGGRRFTDEQLDIMAGGGCFVVTQDDFEGSMPYCIFQTTTDTKIIEAREDSIVATIDYISKYYKENLKSVLGKFNVNTISVKYVESIINNITNKLQRMTYPYIGPLLISGTLKGISTEADKIKPVVSIKVPFPVNGVDLTLEV